MYLSEKIMTNPLIQAYRKPALYINLPSGGKYYNPAPKLSVDNELAVYAMTAKDELITKTPDALFNGEATVSLIRSCCPDIPNPTQIPVNDLMVIMLAIRQASYNGDVEVETQCPECSHKNLVGVNCQVIMDSADYAPKENKLVLDNGFEMNISPYNLEDRTTIQIQQIKQIKMIEGLQQAEINDNERQKLFGQTFVELAELTIDLVTNCVTSVQAPGSQSEDIINDKEIIREWLQNITSKDYEKIKNKIDELSEDGISTKFNISCEECSHQWQTNIDLDIANFFAG